MVMDAEILKKRLKEAFGNESQEKVARRLNMTQGSVSKMLSGAQTPTLDTIFNISQSYCVSADWLLGLSEKKNITKDRGSSTYATAVQALLDMHELYAESFLKNFNTTSKLTIQDPLLLVLLRKALLLYQADKEAYERWRETKLSWFENRDFTAPGFWEGERITASSLQYQSELDWLRLYGGSQMDDNIEDEPMFNEKG